ncbi:MULTISPECIES: hypothetical protein [Halorhodospira]|uniref:hypothetical protein n=1 Tax=Halorhodospira TaxID=85108 RepID=UPI001EE89D8B|nr:MULTISPECIES: hypothetical protein [Halorhodospira]MCG5528535.1 hypothetical protein [Halorhodospira halophila]MCG5543802.1 hypothetical protein [Halorhodospira sp. 9628]
MRKFDWTKGALALTAGSVLAIGAGNVAADNWEDSDSFDVEVEVWEPVDVEIQSEPDLDDQYVPGQTAQGDFSAKVGGQDDAEVNVEYSSTGDLSDEEEITVSLPGDETVTLGDDDVEVGGQFSAELGDETPADTYSEDVTVTADYTAF